MANSKAKTQKTEQWSGRFSNKINPLLIDFTQSIRFDRRLAPWDVRGSIAHARMLGRVGILKDAEARQIVKGLEEILKDILEGRFLFREDLEDIHRNIETALIEKIGPVGGKLHTARSRNDQVALDLRLYSRDQIDRLLALLRDLQKALLGKAKEGVDLMMPGYTHLQRAQPVLFAHHLLAYVEMLERDRGRLLDARKRTNVSPLGAGALAGTTFPLDREGVAKELGFDSASRNSLDAVSDRDFAVEIAAAGSLVMAHLSRFAEELVLWSGSEFGFVRLPESFCTGSSMMPQKMNPDAPELVRGKTGRVFGNLQSLLVMLKGLPLAYNRDLQEDKEALFDVFDTTCASVEILAHLVGGIVPDAGRMEAAASDSFLLATEMADWLTLQGLDFRSAHEVTARVVRHAIDAGRDLTALSLEELRRFSPVFSEGIRQVLNPRRAIDRRKVTGGTAKSRVLQEISRLEKVF